MGTVEVGIHPRLGQFLPSHFAFSSPDENGGHPHGGESLQVFYVVPDSDTARPVYFPIFSGSFQQSRAGFAASATSTLGSNPDGRMMGTGIPSVDGYPEAREFGIHGCLDAPENPLVEHPPCNTRLIGNYDQEVPLSTETGKSFRDSGEELGLFRPGKVGDFLEKSPVPVQKNRGTAGHGRSLVKSPR